MSFSSFSVNNAKHNDSTLTQSFTNTSVLLSFIYQALAMDKILMLHLTW